MTVSFHTGLVQKAKKAKDKLLKRDGDDRPDTGSYESFYYGGVDPYMWEPQELGEIGGKKGLKPHSTDININQKSTARKYKTF